MYFTYFLIQTIVIYYLLAVTQLGVNGSLVVSLLILVAAISNVLMLSIWLRYEIFGLQPAEMQEIYSFLMAFIMILQLTYMLFFNRSLIKGLGKYARAYTMVIDRVNFSRTLASVANFCLPARAAS